MKPAVKQIFKDLDQYRDFCRQFGRVFDEAHLYKEKSPYSDFLRWKETGKARYWPGYPHFKPRYHKKGNEQRSDRNGQRHDRKR